jgi:hypothetical protein
MNDVPPRELGFHRRARDSSAIGRGGIAGNAPREDDMGGHRPVRRCTGGDCASGRALILARCTARTNRQAGLSWWQGERIADVHQRLHGEHSMWSCVRGVSPVINSVEAVDESQLAPPTKQN